MSNVQKLFLFSIFFILIFFVTNSSQQNQRLSKIKTKGKWFVDENDRIILFRGINAVQKSYGFHNCSHLFSKTI